MTDFKDYFSSQSDAYLTYRPTYPPELFDFLQSLTPEHDLAWDCGTGNGQAAHGLVEHYQYIHATDASEQQIKNAIPHERIEYKVEKAEHCSLPDKSVDLITIALALHWFDFDSFYAEAKRVLKKEGVIAAWTYKLPSISPEIDNVIGYFHDQVLDDFWQAENRLVERGYTTLPFPFDEISPPSFKMIKQWSLNELLGLIGSWSAVQRLIKKKGKQPLKDLEDAFTNVWRNRTDLKEVSWDLVLKVGRL